MLTANATDNPWIALANWAWIALLFGPWLYALVHALRHSGTEFREVESSKALWVVLLLLVTVFAGIPYLLTVRRRLNERRAARPTTVRYVGSSRDTG